MDVLTTLTVVVFLIGASQGIIYCGILLRSTEQNRAANRILAAILFFFSYRLIVQSMRLFGLGYYDTWYYFMLDFSWVHGALLYIYVKAQTAPSFRLSKKDWWHVVPLALQIVISEFVRLQNLYWDGTAESLSWLGYWGYVVWMNKPTIHLGTCLLIIGYSVKALQLLNQPLPDVSMPSTQLRWLRIIIRSYLGFFSLVLLILLGDWLIFNLTTDESYFYFTRFYYYPYFVGISLLTYWLGLQGFRRKDQVGSEVKTTLPLSKQAQLSEIVGQLDALMGKDQLYTQPELTVQMVAEELGIKPYLVSKALSEVLELRFNDYINRLRVEEVQRLIQHPDNEKYTLLSMAMEAGFNSKSSFNRAVKKHLGVSPSELKGKK